MNFRPALLLLPLAAAAASAVEIDRNSSRASFTFLGGMDIKTGAGEVESFSFAARAPLGKPIHLGDHGLLSIGLAYEATALRIDGAAPGFPLPDADLHQIEFPFLARWHRPDSPWTIIASLSPGIATDFDHIDGDDFYLGGRPTTGCSNSPAPTSTSGGNPPTTGSPASAQAQAAASGTPTGTTCPAT